MSSSNRSPSPMLTRTNPNPSPDSRNSQERVGAARKSFTGTKFAKPSLISHPRCFNPVTPANSPAEYSHRSSFRNDGVRDYEQKENEQDPNSKPTRLRSPSVGKGPKNFMSNTISAASKINASPRKKVLGERNEAVRTSASLSAGKFHFHTTEMSEIDVVHDHVQKSEAEKCRQTNSTTLPSSKTPEFQKESTESTMGEPIINLAAPDDNNIESMPDDVVLSPDVPLNPSKSTESVSLPEMSPSFAKRDMHPDTVANSTSSMIVPHDVDSDLLPYDPKNNYLSPRPLFLHYRPKPRVEAYLNQGIRLEDAFVSENSSEAESSNEETSPLQEPSKECEDSSSVEEPVAQEGKPEPFPVPEASVGNEAVPKHKSSIFTWSNAFLLILVVSLAFPLATHSPSIIVKWHQNHIISKIYDESHKVADISREHFQDLCHNLKLKLVKSSSHLSLIIGGVSEAEKFSPLRFKNVTLLQENGGGDYVFEQFVTRNFEEEGNVELFDELRISKNEDESNIQNFSGEGSDGEPEVHVPCEESQEMVSADLEKKELEENSALTPRFENSAQPDMLPGESILEDSKAPGTQQGFLTENTTPENLDVLTGVADELRTVIKGKDQSIIFSDDTGLSSLSSSKTLQFEVESESSTRKSAAWNAELWEAAADSLNQLLAENIAVVASVSAALLLATAVLICAKLRKYSAAVNELLIGVGNSISKSVASTIKPLISESPYSQSAPVDSDMEGESCPSEMSSLQRCSTYSKGGSRVAYEAQSQERRAKGNHKRESLASSSPEYTTGSPSFGSFTTYSIVHSRHGDEEVMTPVRRSSRIRNQVTCS